MIPLLRRTVQAGSIPAAIRDNLLDCYSNNSRRFLRLYFYPRSPCGERLICNVSQQPCVVISIHALLAESDARGVAAGTACGISIHALLAESDNDWYCNSPIDTIISIHALLAESDVEAVRQQHASRGFLSTLSLRRATTFRKVRHLASKNFYPRSPCGERLICG